MKFLVKNEVFGKLKTKLCRLIDTLIYYFKEILKHGITLILYQMSHMDKKVTIPKITLGFETEPNYHMCIECKGSFLPLAQNWIHP